MTAPLSQSLRDQLNVEVEPTKDRVIKIKRVKSAKTKRNTRTSTRHIWKPSRDAQYEIMWILGWIGAIFFLIWAGIPKNCRYSQGDTKCDLLFANAYLCDLALDTHSTGLIDPTKVCGCSKLTVVNGTKAIVEMCDIRGITRGAWACMCVGMICFAIMGLLKLYWKYGNVWCIRRQMDSLELRTPRSKSAKTPKSPSARAFLFPSSKVAPIVEMGPVSPKSKDRPEGEKKEKKEKKKLKKLKNVNPQRNLRRLQNSGKLLVLGNTTFSAQTARALTSGNLDDLFLNANIPASNPWDEGTEDTKFEAAVGAPSKSSTRAAATVAVAAGRAAGRGRSKASTLRFEEHGGTIQLDNPKSSKQSTQKSKRIPNVNEAADGAVVEPAMFEKQSTLRNDEHGGTQNLDRPQRETLKSNRIHIVPEDEGKQAGKYG